MNRGSTKSISSHEEALGSVSSFSAALSNCPESDKSASLSSASAVRLETLERDNSDTLTLSAAVAVTNELGDEAPRLLSQETTPEEEVETATLPGLTAVSNNGTDPVAPEEEESQTATLPSVAALEQQLEAESTTEGTLPKTALWTAVSVENKEAVTTQKEKKAINTLKTRIWSAIPKEKAQEQATVHQTGEEDILHTAVWPSASRTALAPTALYPSVSSSQNVVLTISRSRAILLTLLISFLNILLGVLIVFALLYQLNGTLIYESPAPVRDVRAKVTELEQQASQLAGELETLQEQAQQLEAQQQAFEAHQINTLQYEQNNMKKDLKQAQKEIATLQEESDELQQELSDVVERVTLFDGLLTELQALLQEARLYQSRPLR